MTPEHSPVFPLNTVLYPGRALPLRVFEPRYHAMLEEVTSEDGNGRFVVAATEDPEVGGDATPARIGTVARIEQVSPPGPQRYLLARGEARVHLDRLDRSRRFLQADVTHLPDLEGEGALARAREVAAMLDRFKSVLTCDPTELSGQPLDFSYRVAHGLPVDLAARQALLELPDAASRLKAEAVLIARHAPEFERIIKARRAPWN